MAALYANENFPFPTVQSLRRLGHQVLTVQDPGTLARAASDEQVLHFASSKKLAVITLNHRHFIRLHAKRPDHEGIIVCTFDPDFDALADRVHNLIISNEPLTGKLLRVNRPS